MLSFGVWSSIAGTWSHLAGTEIALNPKALNCSHVQDINAKPEVQALVAKLTQLKEGGHWPD